VSLAMGTDPSLEALRSRARRAPVLEKGGLCAPGLGGRERTGKPGRVACVGGS
jgi:hypothetical protein